MAVFNYAKKEIDAKVVYYGPAISGKTTNLQFIHQHLKASWGGTGSRSTQSLPD